MMSMEKQGGGADKRRRVVLVPYPFQGHITPMFQLGSILRSRGFSVTVAHTEYNSPNPSANPELVFHSLYDGLSGYDMSGYNMSYENMVAAFSVMFDNCGASLQEYLVDLKEKEKQEIACIIYDNIMFFVDAMATHLNIPSIILRTSSANYLHALLSVLQLSDTIFPFQDCNILEPLPPDLHPLRLKDLPVPTINNHIPEPLVHISVRTNDIRSSVACIWNSVDELEHSSLSKLQHRYKVPFFPIGPFHKQAPDSSTSLLEEDTSCLEWLDRQTPRSVLYISIGSFVNVSEKDLIEMAWGLANSEQPFLWAVRPGSVNGSDQLPEDFKKLVGDRGRIVKWAPQRTVLSHSAVGGFMSHCGWNSTLESICEGVPMICTPFLSDQPVNARYLTQVWKVGMELEGVERGVIETTIRKLMAGDEGREVRKRVVDLKQKLECCMQKGGSSYQALDELVDFISSLP